MEEKKGLLSGMFNWKSMAWTVTWGAAMFLIGGVVDFTFFHEHPMGQAMIEAVKDPILNSFDWIASALGYTEYMRNPSFLSAAGVACMTAVDEFGAPVPGC